MMRRTVHLGRAGRRGALLAGVLLPFVAAALPDSTARLYATVDVYADYARASGRYAPSLRSGGMSPSYVGFVWDVQLDDDLKASVRVESLVNVVDRAWRTTGVGDRIATASLGGRFGLLSVGRQFTPHILFLGAEVDPFGTGFSGSAYAVLAAGVDVMRRTNAIFYEAPRVHGVGGQMMVARDATTENGAPVGSDDVFVRTDYSRAGLLVGALYVDQRRLDGDRRRQVATLGGTYELRGFQLTGGAQRVLEAGASFTDLIAGARRRFGAHEGFASWGFSRSDRGRAGAQVYGIAYAYSATARITLYTSAAWLQNFGSSHFDLGTTVTPGGSTWSLIVGGRVRL